MVEILLAVVQSDAFVALMVGVFGIIISKGYAKVMQGGSDYEKYQGYMSTVRPYLIEAIKMAEKTIPDDYPNKAIAKADYALRIAVKLLSDNKLPTVPELLRQAINDVHSDVEFKMEYDARMARLRKDDGPELD